MPANGGRVRRVRLIPLCVVSINQCARLKCRCRISARRRFRVEQIRGRRRMRDGNRYELDLQLNQMFHIHFVCVYDDREVCLYVAATCTSIMWNIVRGFAYPGLN